MSSAASTPWENFMTEREWKNDRKSFLLSDRDFYRVRVSKQSSLEWRWKKDEERKKVFVHDLWKKVFWDNVKGEKFDGPVKWD